MRRILFVDPDHGARSHMAEAIMRDAASDRFDVDSAGTEPGGSLAGVADVLREVGIRRFSPAQRSISTVLDSPPDVLVVVCEEDCGACPYVPGARQVLRWPEPDPDKAPPEHRLTVLREIRSDLHTRVGMLANLPSI